ncbi:MAG: formamidopyrimidine-DNA glycosylase [Fuerstiella sp.]
MVRGVRPVARGRQILEMEFCRCDRKPITTRPAPASIRRQVNGQQIVDVERLAKRVVLLLESEARLVIEPRMTGLMLVDEPPSVEHRRVCWHLNSQPALPSSIEFWDRRGLGTVSLLKPNQFAELRSRLGPDALQLDGIGLRSILQKTSRPVKVALLEQHLIAGIGNLYASEILHRAEVSPRKKSSRVTRAECGRIADATQFVLHEAIRYEGSTLGDGTYRNVLNQDGSYQNQHRVYQKAGETCPVCRTGTIRRIVQAQRSTFFCPRCQRA